MSMMYEAPFLIALMSFLVVVAAGAFLGLRIYGARQVADDHPVRRGVTPRAALHGKRPAHHRGVER